MFVRPVLCRICEFPVADAGVEMAELDLEKLSRWWLHEFGFELDDDLDALVSGSICQFCICDASFKCEVESDSGDYKNCDWWLGHDRNQFFNNFYLKTKVIAPCKVQIASPLLTYRNCKNENPTADSTDSTIRIRVWKPPQTCIYCLVTFKSKLDLIKHVSVSHPDLKDLFCTTCRVYFKSQSEKNAHLEKLHFYFKCHFCQKGFRNVSSLWDHIVLEHQEPDLKFVTCCNEKFESRTSFFYHLRPHLSQIVNCVYCGEEFNVRNVGRHIKYCHSSESIVCDYKCGKYFLTAKEKRQHELQVHESKPGLIQCVYCPMKLSAAYISCHVTKEHVLQSIRCKYSSCLTYFTSEKEREDHTLKVHLTAKAGVARTCVYCVRKPFTNQKLLDHHVRRMHASLKIIKCEIRGCDSKYFITKADLDKHFKQKHADHERKKVFACTHCDFKAVSQLTMNYHVGTQHTVAPVKCESCTKICKSAVALKAHVYHKHKKSSSVCIHCNKPQRNLNDHLFVVPCFYCNTMKPCSSLMTAHKTQCRRSKKS